MTVTLYTIGCPKCKILEKKLKQNNITYVEEANKDKMISLGLSTTPVLEVDGTLMEFEDANKWINNHKQED